ncbi:4-alpha-glucanotransferase [Hydrogenophaga sp. NFH-34]|uniref:4-alpha-glucanotransferase n=1 Tax=Hydrogenophaga sp. NFH-34 TaxID=2744446 RepID=UPI001F2BB85F|nr:4-alpha-glucanotransferase [Hydrogenophaga sp. NFH-34]
MSIPADSLLARRSSGVLLHITSLPGPNGCGDLGPAARHFVDWLVAAGQSAWQVLPLSPAGPGNSPYQSVSAFAGSPLMVDLDDLVHKGWLPWMPHQGFDHQRCDFGRVRPWRMASLRQAWKGFGQRASAADREDFATFAAAHAHWLDDYALFMVLDARHGGPWTTWPQPLARREADALQAVRDQADADLGFWRFVQWRFWVQWQALRRYASERGVQIIGDAPIFVAHHSADVWAHANQFLLDERGDPFVVAGVPPDYFSPTGQRWGNPLYDWDAMAHDGYRWWKDRLAHTFRQVDVVRLDHFRGFEAHWEIPATEPTAIAGRWQRGPGQAFFDAVQDELGSLSVIAEDLGLITPEVDALRAGCGFPGMRILHFAFGGDPANPYLPHNYERGTVAYTGTHDNDTSVGWWRSAAMGEKAAARAYAGRCMDQEPHWTLIHSVSQSVANTAIVPFQDVLGLDSRHRMNTPGLASGCWEWRFDWSQVDHIPAERLLAMTRAHGRLPPGR